MLYPDQIQEGSEPLQGRVTLAQWSLVQLWVSKRQMETTPPHTHSETNTNNNPEEGCLPWGGFWRKEPLLSHSGQQFSTQTKEDILESPLMLVVAHPPQLLQAAQLWSPSWLLCTTYRPVGQRGTNTMKLELHNIGPSRKKYYLPLKSWSFTCQNVKYTIWLLIVMNCLVTS